MADDTSKELRQRRAKLSESVSALIGNRDRTYRENSDARALNRAGVTQRAPEEIEQLGADETAADEALHDAKREIRRLDEEIAGSSSRGFGARVGRALRRER